MNPPAPFAALPWAGLLLATALATGLIGCAIAPPATPEQQVAKLAQKRWDALLAGKWETAYAMLAPSYRATTPFIVWRGKFGGQGGWSAAEVHRVKCETTSACNVRMVVSVQLPAITRNNKPLSAPVDEAWVEEDGGWWLLDRQ